MKKSTGLALALGLAATATIAQAEEVNQYRTSLDSVEQ